MIRTNFLLICLIFSLNRLKCQREVGAPCEFRTDGSAGFCVFTSDCESATQLDAVGIVLDICFYSGRDPVVCCPGDATPQTSNSGNRFVETTSKATTTTKSNYADGIVFQNELSKSELKCDEYRQPVTNFISALPLLPDPEPVNVAVPNCDYRSVPLIVGGEPAAPAEFPHMAAIGYLEDSRIKYLCGGTLISENFVLTAAHCTGGTPVKVRLGALNLKRTDDGAQHLDVGIADMIVHPGYNGSTVYNDIALLQLTRRIRFTKAIRPACLWTTHAINEQKAIATGWGQTDYAARASDDLLRVVLDIIDLNTCAQLYKPENSLPDGLKSNQLCAGDLHGGKDTCFGDSGGPLTISSHGNQCVFYVIGITAFGKACGGVNSPGVYTRVSSYIPWIEEYVWAN